MKIERYEITKSSIENFADKNGLIMEVHERPYKVGDPERYYAHFKNSEVREGIDCLLGLMGSGSTPDEAIAEYAKRLSLRLLIIDSFLPSRREIKVPRLL